MDNKPWIALFSQTGSEIAALSAKIGAAPSLILTNNIDSSTWHPFIREQKTISGDHETIMQTLLDENKDNNHLVTLHGYLKIIPNNICSAMDIYNGHPGLITRYPELKGLDPQEKVAENISRFVFIGSVVHKVTNDVDGGEVLSSFAVLNGCNSRDEVYSNLRTTSLHAWLKFFKDNKCELV